MKKTCFFALLIIFQNCLASEGYIQADEESGQGVFRNRGNECFMITARHVVDESQNIYVITTSNTKLGASLAFKYNDDIAVIRIENEYQPCLRKQWSHGDRLTTILKHNKEAEIRMILDNGSIKVIPVLIVGGDEQRNIKIAVKNTNETLRKGFSGSTVYIGNTPIGMLVNVENSVGIVLRQDYISGVISTFFDNSASSQAATKQIQAPVDSVQANRTKSAASATNTENPINTKNRIIIGGSNTTQLAKDSEVRYRFTGEKNSPLMVDFTRPANNMSFVASIYTKNKKQVWKTNVNYMGGGLSGTFTPPETGEYTLKLVGARSHSKVTVSLQQYTTNEALTGKANVLDMGENADVLLAEQSEATFRFTGEKNSPLMVNFTRPGNHMSFAASIYTKNKKQVWNTNVNYIGGGLSGTFTPPETGEYTLKLVGARSHSKVTVSLQQYTTNEALTGKANVLDMGENADVLLAEQSEATFRFAGEKNSPLMVNFTRPANHMSFVASIYTKNKKQVWNTNVNYIGGGLSGTFTPPETGEYTLKLVGARSHSKVTVSLEQYTTNDKLTGKANIIDIGDTVDIQLAQNARAVYRFAADKNASMLIEFTKPQNHMSFTAYVYNSKNKQIWKRGVNYLGGGLTGAFLPPESGQYKLVLVGQKSYSPISLSILKQE